MNSANELGSELALAFLVEKKYADKMNSSDILALIGKVKEVLQPLSAKEKCGEKFPEFERTAQFASY